MTVISRLPLGAGGPGAPEAGRVAGTERGASAAEPVAPELVDLYYALAAPRLAKADWGVALQFIAPSGGSGLTIAWGFARAAASVMGGKPMLVVTGEAEGERLGSVLFVDYGPAAPSGRASLADLTAVQAAGVDLRRAIAPVAGVAGLAWARLGPVADGTMIGPLLDALRRLFGVVVLAGGGACEAEALACAGHADGAVIVVEEARTSAREIEQMRARIERRSGHVAGTVFNRAPPKRGWLGRRGL